MLSIAPNFLFDVRLILIIHQINLVRTCSNWRIQGGAHLQRKTHFFQFLMFSLKSAHIGGSRPAPRAHPLLAPNSFIFACIFTEKCPCWRSVTPPRGRCPPVGNPGSATGPCRTLAPMELPPPRHPMENPGSVPGSMFRQTEMLIRQYLLPLKTDHLGAVLVTGDLSGPSDQYGPFSQ